MADTRVEKTIVDLLTPYFGAKMAEGIVLLSCQSLHIEHGAITQALLPSIAQDIKKRMSVFLGTEKTEAVAKQILQIKV